MRAILNTYVYTQNVYLSFFGRVFKMTLKLGLKIAPATFSPRLQPWVNIPLLKEINLPGRSVFLGGWVIKHRMFQQCCHIAPRQ